MSNHFAIIAWDGPNSAELRAAANADHFAHIETIMDKIAIAGPLKDDEGQNIGSMLVLKAESVDEAEAIMKSDPYFKAGVWARWDVRAFLPAAGNWIGGKIW
jgi:uncharacterized protein